MHSIGIQKVMSSVISLFYYIGFWHREENPTPKELKKKLLYCLYHSVFLVSLVTGAITSEKGDDAVFLTEAAIGIGAVNGKLWILLWKQSQIRDLLNRVCVFSIRFDDDVVFIKDKLRGFTKFAVAFCIVVLLVSFDVPLIPFMGSEKTLVLDIWFPLDYKNSEIAFWITNIYIFTGAVISSIVTLFSVIIWCLLLSCSLRYEVLGSELKKIGRISEEEEEVKPSKKEKCRAFVQDMKASIDDHLHIRGLTKEVESFFSGIFFIQFATSGLCICGSVYSLAFDVGDNTLKGCLHVLMGIYFISDLFMITYFGNEIMLSSDRLSYSLFESDWIEQPQATKECLIIFGEYLKQPQQLIIGKLYPLTLDTFTRILRSAYSMFNILKKFQK